MHTLHWIAVEAENRAEAEDFVLNQLLSEEGTWWDWFDETIGGRWTEAKTVCAQDSDKYKEVIDSIITNRKTEVKEYMERTDMEEIESFIPEYDGETLGWDYQMNFYRIGQVAKLIGDEYFHGSYFYDMENWTPSISYLKERVTKDSAKQYLVPIDFHY
jgi:hypothetical protein